jgi:hypothetical protein
MTEAELDALRQRLPLLRALEERGFVQFCSDGVYVVRDIPFDDFTPPLQDEFALADEWSSSS